MANATQTTSSPHNTMLSSSNLSTSSAPHHTWATAADLPMEICKLVVDFVAGEDAIIHDGDHFLDLDASVLQTRKHILGLCALVCRAWAPVCQRRIFERIVLRSRVDYFDLLRMVSRVETTLPPYVKHLFLEPDATSTPWLHLLAQTSRLRLCSPSPFDLISITLRLRTASHRPSVQRGIHHLLPRALPLFSSFIETLHLADMRLSSIGDVLSLCKDLKSLHTLYCSNITWDEGTGKAPTAETEGDFAKLVGMVPRRGRYAPQRSCYVTLRGCKESQWAAIFLVCSVGIGRLVHTSTFPDLHAVCRIAETIARQALATCPTLGARARIDASSSQYGASKGFAGLRPLQLTYYSTENSTNGLHVDFLLASDSANGGPSHTYTSHDLDALTSVYAIHITFPKDGLSALTLSDVLQYDWSDFDALASSESIAALRCVVLDCEDPRDVVRVFKGVLPQLGALREKGVILKCVQHGVKSNSVVGGGGDVTDSMWGVWTEELVEEYERSGFNESVLARLQRVPALVVSARS